MYRDFWRNKKVLITGFEGFLGSNLTKRLLSYSLNVIGIDIKVKRKNTIFTKNEYKTITVIKGNVANFEFLRRVISKYKPEIIFHLAAETIVGRCNMYPIKTFKTNIEGTWNILEICRNYSRDSAIIVASSDKAYGSHKKLPYREDASLQGKHTYDTSKSCADLLVQSYAYTYGLKAAVTRCGNIYGIGDFNFSRIIPDAIRCGLSNKTFIIRSDGKFTRDYVYVEDIVDGYILLAEKLKSKRMSGEAFNFSDENPITVIELVKRIYKLVGKKENYKILDQAKLEIKHQYLASAKARSVLNWKPKVTLEEGLKRTIVWYRQFLKR